MMNLVKSLPLICAVVAVSACQSSPQHTYSGAHPVQRTQDSELNTIVFIDHNLNRTEISKGLLGTRVKHTVKVTVDRSGIGNTDTGTTEVWAMLRNRTDHDLQIEGKSMFFDAAKAPLGDESMWRRVHIPANGTAVYRETSLNNKAKYFLVELREGR